MLKREKITMKNTCNYKWCGKGGYLQPTQINAISSSFINQFCFNLNERRVCPSIKTKYFFSDGPKWIISFSNLVLMNGYIDVPPDKTMFPYKSFLMSTEHFIFHPKGMMTGTMILDIWNLSFPIVMTCLSTNA